MGIRQCTEVQIEQKGRGRAHLFSLLELGNLFVPALDISASGSQALACTELPTVFPGSPGFRQQIMGLLNLHNHESIPCQFMYIPDSYFLLVWQ